MLSVSELHWFEEKEMKTHLNFWMIATCMQQSGKVPDFTRMGWKWSTSSHFSHLPSSNSWFIFLTGVKNADEYELRSIASDPDDIHIYNVKDFQFLVDIVDELSVNLCNSVKGSGREGAISALSEQF